MHANIPILWPELAPNMSKTPSLGHACRYPHRSLHYNTFPYAINTLCYTIPSLSYANPNLGQSSLLTWVKLPPVAMHANIPTLWPELAPNMSKTPSLGHACRYPHRSLHYNTLPYAINTLCYTIPSLSYANPNLGQSSLLTWVKLPPVAMHANIPMLWPELAPNMSKTPSLGHACRYPHRSLRYNTLPYAINTLCNTIPSLSYANPNLGQSSLLTWVKLPPVAMHANIPTLWPELAPNMSKTPSLGHACRYPHHLYTMIPFLMLSIPFAILSFPFPMLILTLARART